MTIRLAFEVRTQRRSARSNFGIYADSPQLVDAYLRNAVARPGIELTKEGSQAGVGSEKAIQSGRARCPAERCTEAMD
jgi:hypothetical protein